MENENPNIGIGSSKPDITEALLVLVKERDAARKKYEKFKESSSNLMMAYRELQKYNHYNDAIEILMKEGKYPDLSEIEVE